VQLRPDAGPKAVVDPQLYYAAGMGAYVMVILFVTKIPYDRMVASGMEDIRAVYYNRKIVHKKRVANQITTEWQLMKDIPFLDWDLSGPYLLPDDLSRLVKACFRNMYRFAAVRVRTSTAVSQT